MRNFTLSVVALLALAGCKEPTELLPLETIPLSATVTDRNECTVQVLGKTYASIGQVRGDVPPGFVGTLQNSGYHGFGCWVATEGSDGDLVIVFSRDSYQQPLKPGTYSLRFEALSDSPEMTAAVSFRPSILGGDMLRTMDDGPGSVVVEEVPGGGRIIRANTTVFRYSGKL